MMDFIHDETVSTTLDVMYRFIRLCVDSMGTRQSNALALSFSHRYRSSSTDLHVYTCIPCGIDRGICLTNFPYLYHSQFLQIS